MRDLIGSAFKFVYSDKHYTILTVFVSIVMAALYYYLIQVGGLFYPLIFGSILFGKILDIIGFSLISALMGISVSLQVYSYRVTRVDNSKGKTVVAIITGVFAQGLCCTPIIGSFLALLGLSTSTLIAVSGKISHTFALIEPLLIVISALLLIYSIISVSRSLLYCKKGKFNLKRG